MSVKRDPPAGLATHDPGLPEAQIAFEASGVGHGAVANVEVDGKAVARLPVTKVEYAWNPEGLPIIKVSCLAGHTTTGSRQPLR